MILLALFVIVVPSAGGILCALGPERWAGRTSHVIATATAGLALTLAGIALSRPDETARGTYLFVDATGGVFLAVIAVVGAISAFTSPGYLVSSDRSVFALHRAQRGYFATFHVFWALLLAIPLAGNLGTSWLLVEATTAASALLVAFSGRRSALEAGWKYLVLTTLGLTVSLLGIVILFVAGAPVGGAFATLDWNRLPGVVAGTDREIAIVALTLIITGLATKIGWAPVHHWLPDAHSEAPPPVSALLSAALLPTVLLVAWRVKDVFDPALGVRSGQTLLIGFGLTSLAVAVPFLWRPLPWKRLLAYSSLEHMGVIALGIGFGHPVAIAGVVLHVAGHALAKALGFWTSMPLLTLHPQTARLPASGLAQTSPATATAVGLSLISLAGLPPSPLFVSEVFVLFGGVLAGQLWVVAVAGVLLGLGFLGLAHSAIEGVAGRRRRTAAGVSTGAGRTMVVGVAAGLLCLTALSVVLPGSQLIEQIARWSG